MCISRVFCLSFALLSSQVCWGERNTHIDCEKLRTQNAYVYCVDVKEEFKCVLWESESVLLARLFINNKSEKSSIVIDANFSCITLKKCVNITHVGQGSTEIWRRFIVSNGSGKENVIEEKNDNHKDTSYNNVTIGCIVALVVVAIAVGIGIAVRKRQSSKGAAAEDVTLANKDGADKKSSEKTQGDSTVPEMVIQSRLPNASPNQDAVETSVSFPCSADYGDDNTTKKPSSDAQSEGFVTILVGPSTSNETPETTALLNKDQVWVNRQRN
ncbi:hypothetical protein DPEC_G00306400 [Dallia pectoralis]|uniref:Uncharacterized protein n=1 Tax=Dallia pectoralis TaxID=75939 RepID=A0ACC2FE12_DALPE|nr:hypothetical protein DPEC_G00306400 [Dallia pectoralis]